LIRFEDDISVSENTKDKIEHSQEKEPSKVVSKDQD
jgi:hypothetical protein